MISIIPIFLVQKQKISKPVFFSSVSKNVCWKLQRPMLHHKVYEKHSAVTHIKTKTYPTLP